MDSVKCADKFFGTELQNMLDGWNSRLFTLLCSLHCMQFAGSWPIWGFQICLLNMSMCLYVPCYSTERIASLSQLGTQIHQLTLGSPEPIWTYKTCLCEFSTSKSDMPGWLDCRGPAAASCNTAETSFCPAAHGHSFLLWLTGQLVCLPVLFLAHLAAEDPLLAGRAHQLARQIAVITSTVLILHSSQNACHAVAKTLQYAMMLYTDSQLI